MCAETDTQNVELGLNQANAPQVQQLRRSNEMLRSSLRDTEVVLRQQERLNQALLAKLERRDQEIGKLSGQVQALQAQLRQQSACANMQAAVERVGAASGQSRGLVHSQSVQSQFRLSRALDDSNAQVRELQTALLRSRLHAEQLEQRLADLNTEQALQRSSLLYGFAQPATVSASPRK